MAKGSIGSVLANSVFYTFGNMLLKVFSFFLIPLYTAYLQPDQYGILNLASGFTAVVSCIITMGFQYAVIRFYADLKNDLSKVARMFGTIICSIGGGGIVFLCGLFLFRNYWCSCIFKGIDFYPVIFLAILISFVTSLYSVYQDALKGMQQARKSVLLTYVFFFMILVGNILTVVVLNMGAVGILYATLFVNVIMVGIMFVDLIKHELFVFCIDRKILKDLLKYSSIEYTKKIEVTYSFLFIALAGTPTTIELSATDLFIKLHAPTTTFSPITTPSSLRAIIEEFIPMYAPSFIINLLCPCFRP